MKLFCFYILGIFALLHAGPNNDAAIYFDADLAAGNQGVSEIKAPGLDTDITVEVRAQHCEQLDSYSFEVIYQTDDLAFTGFSARNEPNEDNLLNQKGDVLFAYPMVTQRVKEGLGTVTVSAVNTTADPVYASDGDGLLGTLTFNSKVEMPRGIRFGTVKWKDPTGLTDLCPDLHKGEFFMGGGPLPVELSAFHTAAKEGEVVLSWTTESELNSLGFFIYRSVTAENGYERLNSHIIAAAGFCVERRDYSFVDDSVQPHVTYFYKLHQLDKSGTGRWFGPVSVTVTEQHRATPGEFALYQNYPNPFNPSTTIRYDIAEESFVTLEIFDITGKRVRSLVQSTKAPGTFEAVWDASDSMGKMVPNGTYLCLLQAGTIQLVNKLMVLK